MAIRNIKNWLMEDKTRLTLLGIGVSVILIFGLVPLVLHYTFMSIVNIEVIIASALTTGGIFGGLGFARNGVSKKQDKVLKNTDACVEIHKVLQNQINIQSIKTDQTREMIIEILAKLKYKEKDKK